jgi:hypothetical protein
MKNKGQVALAVGAGYLLGRRRKMRLALVLGTAAATGGFGGFAGQILRRGAKLAGSNDVLGKVSPELGEITDMVRGDLLDAGKAAAMTAVRSRIDRMSDTLHDQAEMWRQPHGDDAQAEPDQGAADETVREPEDEETAEEPVDTAEEPEEDEDTRDEAEDDEDTGEPKDTEDTYEEPEDGEEDSQETEDLPARSANGESRRSRSERTTSPVRRTRR